MMKGFAITPILFLGLFLITGIMILNFSDVERRMIDSISKEGRISNLQNSMLEYSVARGNVLLFNAVKALEGTQKTESEVETYVTNAMGGVINIEKCVQDEYFVINNTYIFHKENPESKISSYVELIKTVNKETVAKINENYLMPTCS